ncbi:hypothetical protein [Pendulispora albinea]|uniref:DUF1565 domain-containing protein n=1 Tax=Pendulispora albinea TaxID=2741071 RepID=A0ABZ2MBI5_9BACT
MHRFLLLAWTWNLAAWVLTAGCSESTCEDLGNCAPADPSADGGVDVAPPNCLLDKDPAESPACIDERVGIFVAPSPAGSDTNPGTRGQPMATIQGALAKAAGSKPRVYVCGGTYAENVLIDTGKSISIYGGFACTDWNPSAKLPVTVAPASRIPLTVRASHVTVADIAFLAPRGIAGEPSSIAAIVQNAQKVVLERLTLTAGDAANGADAQGLVDPARAEKGNDASGTTGGSAQPAGSLFTCTNGSGTTQGGAGGSAGGEGRSGEPFGVYDGGPPGPDQRTGAGGAGGVGGTTSCGRNGAHAPSGVTGSGATRLGAIQGGVWIPQDGAPGSMGKAGQGGGGGGGGESGGAGGGGGAGGCGGGAGGAGKGGGGSIALVSVSSGVTIAGGKLLAKAPGNGGKGGAGQKGQIGGFGGSAAMGGCQGGVGGNGGQGGPGGGGAGGVSAGILYVGLRPSTEADPVITTADKGGAGGAGGLPGANDGMTGQAGSIIPVP